MEAAIRTPARLLGPELRRLDLPAIGTWLLGAALIAFLGLSNGGYDVIERSEVGIAVWWIVAVATAVGALPFAGGTRAGRGMLILLAAFAAWTALSLSWTESAERTSVEVGRALTYLGVFALALAVQGNGRWRQLLHGAAAGTALVVGIAVLSRFQLSWFPERETGEHLRGLEIERTLAYPLNYSTGLAGFTAMGLPLLLAVTASARTVLGSALAAAVLPVAVLALWLTGSSLALPAAFVAVAVFLVLAPDRAPKLATLVAAGTGAVILIASVEGRPDLVRGLPTPAAGAQGDEAMVIAILVCVGVASIQAGIALATRHWERPAWLTISRRSAVRGTAVATACVVALGVAAGASGEISDRWESFTGRGHRAIVGPQGGAPGDANVLDPVASGRFKYWESALRANASSPVVGIGAGTFEFWYLRDEGRTGSFARDAHSFLLETLAELGIVGVLLIGSFAVAVLAVGATRALRAPPSLRLILAAATAACAAFTLVAAVDWVWELAILSVAYLVLAAIVVRAGPDPAPRQSEPFRLSDVRHSLRANAGRVALAATGIVAIVAIAIPLAGTVALDRSRDDAAAGDLDGALDQARKAARLQPYAASPLVQEALVHQRAGDLDAAVEAAADATEKESTNWRTWLVLSRIEESRGNRAGAEAARDRALALFPQGVASL